MRKEEKEQIQAYFEASTSWEDDRINQFRKSEKKAWLVAAGASFVALLAIGAVMGLTPLKTVKTEVLVMDKSTGLVEPLQSLKDAQVSLEEVFHRKFLNDFILARENYTFDTAEDLYYTAAAFMSPRLQAQWAEFWNQNNPNSPLNVYKRDTMVHVVINSMTIDTRSETSHRIATIRFTKTIEHGELKNSNHWVATVVFEYVNAPTDEKLRRINPAGFQVLDYHVDPEIGGSQPSNTL